MSFNTLAFFTGLFGSLHCVAMCGPLVMALPVHGYSRWYAVLQRVVYQSGRILTYVVFGLLFGLMGKSFNLLGLQQGISILTGIILIVMALMHFSRKRPTGIEAFQLKVMGPLSKHMVKLLIKPYGGFFAGMLNGILPCGMVYLALAGAVNTGSIKAGAEYMFFFGLGTTPLMLVAAFAGLFFRSWIQIRFSRILPFVTLFMGIWFLLRGADLDIPYFSPRIYTSSTAVC
ncbi:sulfite exporter TauE/SafE family protein [Flavihumibacter sp. R14]|nr:sulfite exporter TauE/SafE family protein [Flavihumibacter soli]